MEVPARADVACRDRVQLNVGGTVMTTARCTLEARSSYFRSMFSRWSHGNEGGEERDWAQEQADLLANMRENVANAKTQVAVLAVMRGRFQRRFNQRSPQQRGGRISPGG